MADSTTPTVRCPRPKCGHPIDDHFADRVRGVCGAANCTCQMTPNLIAVAAIHSALYGELTPTDPAPKSISRQHDGSWS